MNCSICEASARVLKTNVHGETFDGVKCGSYAVSADVLKMRELSGKVLASRRDGHGSSVRG